jgi:hypothetical protein
LHFTTANHNSGVLRVYHFSLSPLAPNSNSSRNPIATAVHIGSYTDIYDFTTRLRNIVPAKYGVHAITLRRGATHTQVRFWPCAPTQLDDFGQFPFHDAQEARIPGADYLMSPRLFDTGRSGKSVIVLTQAGVNRYSLYRVQYIHDATSVHKLQLPSSLALSGVNHVALDDHRGTIYISTKSGTLFCIPFA